MAFETVAPAYFTELCAFATMIVAGAPLIREELPVGEISVASALGLFEQELRSFGVDISQHPNGITNVALGIARKIDGVAGVVRLVSVLPQLPRFKIVKGELERRIGELWIPSNTEFVTGTNVICAEYTGSICTDSTALAFAKTLVLRATVLGTDEKVQRAYTVLPQLNVLTVRPTPESMMDALEHLVRVVKSALEAE